MDVINASYILLLISIIGAAISTISYISHGIFNATLKPYCQENAQLARAYRSISHLNLLLCIATQMSTSAISGPIIVDGISKEYPGYSIAYILATVAALILLDYLFRYSVLHEQKDLLACWRFGQLVQLPILCISLKQVCDKRFLIQHPISSPLLIIIILLRILLLVYLQRRSMTLDSVFGSGLSLKVKQLLDDGAITEGVKVQIQGEAQC